MLGLEITCSLPVKGIVPIVFKLLLSIMRISSGEAKRISFPSITPSVLKKKPRFGSPKAFSKSTLPTLNPVVVSILVNPDPVAAYKKPLSTCENIISCPPLNCSKVLLLQ
jgi:hypothetical protein